MSMQKSVELSDFLRRIMLIEDHILGGAAAGIIGSSRADSSLIHTLKQSALVFANKYRNTTTKESELVQSSDEVMGLIRGLHLLGTLSESESQKLIQQLATLTQAHKQS